MIVEKCNENDDYRHTYIDAIIYHLSQYISDDDILQARDTLTEFVSRESLTNYGADDVWALIQAQLYKDNNFTEIIEILLNCMPDEHPLSIIEVEMLFEEKDDELFGPDGCALEERSYNPATGKYEYFARYSRD